MGVGSFLSGEEMSFIKDADASRMLPDLDSFKTPFRDMAKSVIEGFDDLSWSVKRSSNMFALGLAGAGLFIGCGIVVGSVLTVYLQQREAFVPKEKRAGKPRQQREDDQDAEGEEDDREAK